MISNTKYQIQNTPKGFTLIEALTLLFIFSVITITFYYVLSNGLGYIQNSKNRLGAISVANEKVETIRNLEYDDIGTQNGEISGDIPDDETVLENTKQYDIHTLVEYIDDPFDGLEYSDEIWFEDYKKVTVTVSWGNGEVKIVSRFVPPGAEVPQPGDGILSINIFSDQSGAAVSGSTVHVVNSETGLDSEKQTDSVGNVTFSGDKIRNSLQKYKVTVTKSDYETVTTLPPYPDTAFNPVDVHASVVVGMVNVVNFIQNKLADLKISSVDSQNQSVAEVGFIIEGGRKIGTELEFPNNPMYNLDTSDNTGSSGEKSFSDISPGQYALEPNVSADYELVGTEPVSPFTLHSEESLTFKIKLAKKNVTSLLVKVRDSAESDLSVSGAQVKLSNAFGYDVTQTTGVDGAVVFPNNSDAFEAGDYDLKVTADGFSESNSQVTINLNELKIETIILTANP